MLDPDRAMRELKLSIRPVFLARGLPDTWGDVYAVLLSAGSTTRSSLVEKVGGDPSAVAAALDGLLENGLAGRSQDDDDMVMPLNPQSTLHSWRDDAEAAVLEAADQASRLRRQVPGVLESFEEHRVAAEPVRLVSLTDRDAIVAELETLNASCQREVLAMVSNKPGKGALKHSRSLDLALLHRGVAVRSIYLDSTRHETDLMEYLHWLHCHGGEIRLAPTVPVRLLVFDRATAVLAHDPADLRAGALVVTHPGMLAGLVHLFELAWDSADRAFARPTVTEGLSAVEREMLRLFSRGAKDEAVARRLDVSVRTVRRTVAQLGERLSVTSRFELGVRAVELGWIGGQGPTSGARPSRD